MPQPKWMIVDILWTIWKFANVMDVCEWRRVNTLCRKEVIERIKAMSLYELQTDSKEWYAFDWFNFGSWGPLHTLFDDDRKKYNLPTNFTQGVGGLPPLFWKHAQPFFNFEFVNPKDQDTLRHAKVWPHRLVVGEVKDCYFGRYVKIWWLPDYKPWILYFCADEETFQHPRWTFDTTNLVTHDDNMMDCGHDLYPCPYKGPIKGKRRSGDCCVHGAVNAKIEMLNEQSETTEGDEEGGFEGVNYLPLSTVFHDHGITSFGEKHPPFMKVQWGVYVTFTAADPPIHIRPGQCDYKWNHKHLAGEKKIFYRPFCETTLPTDSL